MSDLKSKLPSFNELGKMAGKMFNAIKFGVNQVIDEYKKNHPIENKETNNAKAPSVEEHPASKAETTVPKTKAAAAPKKKETSENSAATKKKPAVKKDKA